MLPIFIVGISCTLLGGFIILTALERRHGRVLGTIRSAMDKRVAYVVYIIRHIDWSSFVKHLITTVGERILHDTAHVSLVLVRSIERFLTRAVRSLRERRAGHTPRTNTVSQVQLGYRKARIFFRSQILRKKNKDDTIGGS